MKSFIDSRLFAFGELIYNLMIINLMIFIGCLGLVTIGPSLCAGVQMVKTLRANASDNLVRQYVLYFKRYLKNGSLLALMSVLWIPIIQQGLTICKTNNYSTLSLVIGGLAFVLLVVVIGAFQSLVNNKNRNIIQLVGDGMLQCRRNFFKYSLSIILFIILVWTMTLFVITLPVAMSASIYLIEVLLASFKRNSEGDNPVDFLNAFENTN